MSKRRTAEGGSANEHSSSLAASRTRVRHDATDGTEKEEKPNKKSQVGLGTLGKVTWNAED